MNAWDKYLEQRKQKRKERKREREQAEAGDDQNGDAAPPGDSLLEDDEEELSKHQIDWNDPFFSSALGGDAGARKAAKKAAKKGAQAEPEETEVCALICIRVYLIVNGSRDRRAAARAVCVTLLGFFSC